MVKSEPGSITTTCSTAVVAQVVEQRHSVQVGRVQITGPTYTFWFRFAVKSMHHSIQVVKEEPSENRLTANLNRKKPSQMVLQAFVLLLWMSSTLFGNIETMLKLLFRASGPILIKSMTL